MSLAELTATYTDSEEDDGINEPELAPLSPDNSTTDSFIRAQKSGLVSYGEPGDDDDDKLDENLNSSNEQIIELINTENVLKNDYEVIPMDTNSNDEDEEFDVKLPPEPKTECSAQLQEKIAKLYEKKLQFNFDTIASIQRRKDFRNPSIYEKLISYCSIDELASNYPPDIYDPHKWESKSYYDELAKSQRTMMDKREKEKKAKVEFVSGTVKKTSNDSAADEVKKRKSKWDVVPGTGQKSDTVIQPVVPIINSATGNKSTVISAFGMISKKK